MIISWKTKYTLSRLSRRAAPDRVFDLTLRNKLAEAGYLPKSSFGFFSFSAWKTVSVSASLVLSLAGGTGVYAYSSSEVLPSHSLYSVRIALEQAELALPQSEQQRDSIRLKHLQRRVSEAEKLNARHLPVPESHKETLLATLETVATPAMESENTIADSVSEKADETRQMVSMDNQELSDLMDERKAADSDDVGQVIDEELSQQMEQVNKDLGRLQKDREEQQKKQEGRKSKESGDE